MIQWKSITLSALALTFAGCSSVQVTEQNAVSERVGQDPKIGIETITPVGGSVYSQYRFVAKTGYRLIEPVNMGFMLGRVSANAGDILAKANFDGKAGYCTERPTYIDPLTGPLKTTCYVESEPGRLSSVHVAPGLVWFDKPLPFPVRFEKSDTAVPGTSSFKYELLYQGLSNKSLKLSYREYSNDMARPAFFQEVSYDVPALPMTIAFRNVRIEVLDAGNNGLTYKILSPF